MTLRAAVSTISGPAHPACHTCPPAFLSGNALRAARFLGEKPAGMYDMQDVLGLK